MAVDKNGSFLDVLTPTRLAAEIKLLKVLTDDLDYNKPNFGSTVEGIIQHAEVLRKHERTLRNYNPRKS